MTTKTKGTGAKKSNTHAKAKKETKKGNSVNSVASVNDDAKRPETGKGNGRNDANSQLANAMIRESVDYMELKGIVAANFSAPMPDDLQARCDKWAKAVELDLMTAADVEVAKAKYIASYQKEHPAKACTLSDVVRLFNTRYAKQWESVIGCPASELTEETAKVYAFDGTIIGNIVTSERTALQIITDVMSYRNFVAARRAKAWENAILRKESVNGCYAAALACFNAGVTVEESIKLFEHVARAYYANEEARKAARELEVYNARIDLRVLDVLLCDALAFGHDAKAKKLQAYRKKVLALIQG